MNTPLVRARRQQRGIYTIMTALVLVVLIGFIGLAIDSSRQQSVHVELQNAADACVLAAVWELNGLPDAPARATLAGEYVSGQRNYKDFQDTLATVAGSDVTFSEKIAGPFLAAASVTTVPRYVRCTVRANSFVNNFMAVLGIGQSDLSASAIAALQASRSTCSAPIAVCGNRADSKFGLSTTTALYNSGLKDSGDLYSADFSSCTRAESSLSTQMKKNGACNIITEKDQCTVRPNIPGEFEQAWNTRFGVIHADEVKTPDWVPDLTGYSYPAPEVLPRVGKAVYDPAALGSNPYADYKAVQAPGRVAFSGTFPGYSKILSHSELLKLGAPNRRLIVFPVIDCAGGNNKVIGWACGLMLNPVNGSGETANYRIQYIGLANASDSPCATAGIPGGGTAIGPLVPTLIQ